MVKVGINGFGRIGRLALRICEKNKEVDVVAINSRASTESHAHLLKYDTMYGHFDGDIEVKNDNMIVNGKEIKVFRENDPSTIDWASAGVEIVIEATGKFRKREDAAKHLSDSVKRVILSAPGKGDDGMFVMGVNHETYDPSVHTVFSCASCTTNGLSPVVKILDEKFGLVKGLMTTIHSVTSGQRILDNSHKDFRRARTAGYSIIPTTTGAAKSVGKVLPNVAGKLNGMCIRVPTATVSIVDLTAEVGKEVTVEEVNKAFIEASKGDFGKYLGVSDEPLVSSDYIGESHSSVVDLLSTDVMGGNMVKVLAWYDNEWGYACRLVDLTAYVAGKGL